MTKKIFKNIFLACFSMLVVTIVIVFGVMYNYHGKQIMNELHSEINIISVGVEDGGTKYLDTLSKSEKSRITWVNKDGTILMFLKVKWKTTLTVKKLRMQ